MKKNVMMRLASFLLVAVLISTSAISGTYAKYVTSGESKDSARVAKWGVTVSADYKDTFTRGYKLASTESTDDAGEASVWADAVVDVVAPGTAGALADFEVTGTPEVDVVVTYEADLELENWEITSGEYCPLIFTVNGVEYYIGADIVGLGTITTVFGLENAVEKAINDSTKSYNAGDNLGDALTGVAKDLEVSWKWQFDSTTVDFRAADGQTDGQDTEIGNWSTKGKAAPTVSIEVSCTITQVD